MLHSLSSVTKCGNGAILRVLTRLSGDLGADRAVSFRFLTAGGGPENSFPLDSRPQAAAQFFRSLQFRVTTESIAKSAVSQRRTSVTGEGTAFSGRFRPGKLRSFGGGECYLAQIGPILTYRKDMRV